MDEADVSFPGGGVVCLVDARVGDGEQRDLHVFDQMLDDGRRFRWLCSRATPSEPLCSETVVALLRSEKARRLTRGATSGSSVYRAVLLPEYHRAMVAGLGLATAAPLRSLLVLGVGGGALPLHLATHHPRCRMIGVEADARVLELASQHFGCRPGPKLTLHAQSAEAYLRASRARPRRFDAVLLDASHGDRDGGHRAPPPRLATRAALRRLRRRLRVGGALVVNVLGSAAHCAHVRTQLVAASAACDEVREIGTAEGNTVVALVRRARVDDDTTWLAACAALGLRTRRLASR
jgi:hypothetical protein